MAASLCRARGCEGACSCCRTRGVLRGRGEALRAERRAEHVERRGVRDEQMRTTDNGRRQRQYQAFVLRRKDSPRERFSLDRAGANGRRLSTLP